MRVRMSAPHMFFGLRKTPSCDLIKLVEPQEEQSANYNFFHCS